MVAIPSRRDLEDHAGVLGFDLAEDELETFIRLAPELLEPFAELDAAYVEPSRSTGSNRSWRRPSPEENELGAWLCLSEVRETNSGRLAGRRLAIKDTVSVAGLPTTLGTSLRTGHLAKSDAPVVSRILAEGGTIAGKAVCECLCFSGGSHTAGTGIVRNPHDCGRSAGGSSSGCAVLVAQGEVDLAIGSDQGGSIRIPSSWCGIVGLKPTYGLVPYAGAFPFERTLDNLGPMGRTAADVAVLLDALVANDVVAGGHEVSQKRCGRYAEAVEQDAAGLRVGVLEEGFGSSVSQLDVDANVHDAIACLEKVGCSTRPVSVPLHRLGAAICAAIELESAVALAPYTLDGKHGEADSFDAFEAFFLALEGMCEVGPDGRALSLPPNVKLSLLLGLHVREQALGRYYVKAQMLGRQLEHAYSAALNDCDLLALPTVPMTATPLPALGANLEQVIRHAHGMTGNTAPFNVSGHPAISVPCGTIRGLPVGLMLVGRRGEDSVVLRGAALLERAL